MSQLPPHHCSPNEQQRHSILSGVHINIENGVGRLDQEREGEYHNKICDNKVYIIDHKKYNVNDTVRWKWQTHRGRNRFFCDGRFIMAQRSSVFLLTLFLIFLTMILFCVFDLPYLARTVSIAIPLLSGALFFLVISSLFKTALSDPGIIPRASPREVLEWERQYQESDPFFHRDEWAQTRATVLNIRGQNVKTKYCYTCCIFRPPRSSHCSICDNCVLNFDHHCPWLGNCIGVRNYRHFYLFITTLSFLDAFMGICVGVHLYLLSFEKGNFLDAIKESPLSMLTGFINIISIWSVLGLSGFHTYLLALAQTTNEDIKGTFNRKLHPQVKNPYNTGNCFKNIFSSLCTSERPSLLDRRGLLVPEDDIYILVDFNFIKNFTTMHEQKFGLSTVNNIANNCSQSLGKNELSKNSKNAVITKKRNSCPSSPHRQRRNNNATQPSSSLKTDVIEVNHQRQVALPIGESKSLPNQTQQQHKTRICYSNNLIAPTENTQNIEGMRKISIC